MLITLVQLNQEENATFFSSSFTRTNVIKFLDSVCLSANHHFVTTAQLVL